ncbi:hypothetical protein WBG78_27665 [Chryseolinea sp. T2]|uniref:hypothetical protein n=1 Tax=Chryseolinea sp. T2 TaxID=3129255 RepID=UPI003076F0A7
MKIAIRVQLILVILLASVGELMAQKDHVFLQHAHTFPKEAIWWDSVYLYPEFRPGFITYFTGFTPERDLRLNYNLYFGQIDIIDDHNDTVQISPSKTFKSVSIGGDVFLYDAKEGYLRVMITGDVTLALRTFFHLSEIKYGGLGPKEDMVDVRGRPSSYDRYFIKASIFFFVDKAGSIFPASRVVLKKFFPEYKHAIQEFSKKHNTDFTEADDLRQITEFCNGLRRIPTDNAKGMIVRANERISHTLRDSMYRFSEFQEGVIFYQDGRRRQYSSLNYNLFNARLETIENGDTVGINTNQFVTTVNIDGTTYFRRPEGFVEILLSGPVNLGVVRKLVMSHSQAVVASSKYGPGTTYDEDLASIDQARVDRMFTRKNEYFLMDGSGTMYPPSVTSMRRLYPSAGAKIDEYIKEHKPDFGNEKAMMEMVSYFAGKAGK